MRSKQVRPVVYSGKVGAKMKPPMPRKESKTAKIGYGCQDGPIAGHVLHLTGDGCTMVLNFAGQIGRYVRGKWEAA